MTRLATYLNDHLGGATAGLELAKRSRGANKGTELGAFLAKLTEEIDEDRETLRSLMRTLAIGEDNLKKAAGWSIEKVGRLKPNGQLRGYSPLSRLIELEGLTSGVGAKRSMWLNLERLAARDERFASFDLPELLARADRQLAQLEQHRVSAASDALTEG
ncbi:hypothetical protein BH20ACT18_BH20ACT18_00250 [soil metagenome]